MNRLVLLAATFVLSTGMMLGQSSPEEIQNVRPNPAQDQTQPGAPPTPPMVPRQPPDTTANPDRPGATPETTLPNTTIDDQQPGNSTTGSPSSTMGTTGSTPGTDQSTDGNQSGAKPDNTQTPDTKPTQPHEGYASGSSNPNSSANGASSNDMSGTNPKPDDTTNSTNPQTTSPHIATHAPDAGTVMNPASVELVTETTDQH
jgi:hypothetical protein